MTPSLRPGCAPARLLLELWARQALGFRESLTVPSPARSRLQELGYVNHLGGWMCRLTPAGRAAAHALDAGSQ